MSTRRASWLAWALCVLAVALSISTIPLVISYIRAAATPGTLVPPGVVTSLQQLSALDWTLSWIQSVMRVVPLLAFSALGALIVSRYPSHVIGWIFCALGVLGAVEPFAAFYAINALFVARGALPGGAAAGWLQNWIWIVSIALVCAFLPLHFPTRRLVSQRWRLARWVVISMTAAMALDRALRPGRLGNSLYGFDIPNPLGVAHVGTLSLVLFPLPLDLLHASMLAAAA